MQSPLQLYYVRHGETEWSLSGQHTGTTDIAMTARGEDAARALEPWLRGVSFDRVFVSPRRRARRTCELAGLGDAAQVEPDLAEWNYGDYEGRRTVDIRAERPGWNLWTDGCPGGESPDDVAARIDALLVRLGQLGGTVALFAHGHIGAVLGSRWGGLAVKHGQLLSLRPASLSILAHDARDIDVRVIDLWNSVPTRFNAGNQ